MIRPRIFVHAPAYRDREMQWTLRDMFEKATYPDRIFAGVCWQVMPETDEDCFVIRPHPDQVRGLHVHAAEARGLGWARGQAQSLWHGEEYSLQIDSHMRFAPGWDQSMLDMLGQCDSPDPVLTHYPAGYDPPDQYQAIVHPIVQCVDKFLPSGILQFTTGRPPATVGSDGGIVRPFPTAACAGGFIFGGSRILRDVPADPEIYFVGEEPSLAVRLWTHGFDLFSPQAAVIYHYYERRDGVRPWHDQALQEVRAFAERTERRMHALCCPDAAPSEEVTALGRFGLGARRTLAAYEAFAGVSFAGRTIAASARKYPWVRTPETRAAFALEGLQRAPGTELFVLGDEGILFAARAGRILKANEGATYAWCALEQGWKWSDIAERMAAGRRERVEAVTVELKDMADHWLDAGLLFSAGAVRRGEDPQRVPRIDPLRHDLRTRHYRLLNTFFHLRVGGAALQSLVAPALTHLEVPAEVSDQTLDVLAIATWFYVFLGNRLIHHGRDASKVLPILKSTMLTEALRAEPHLLHLHAAAVALDGLLVLLPGRSDSGKTLLTARLLVAGAAYYSDETVLIAPRKGHVRPVPTALSVKQEGARRLSDWFPLLSALPEHLREDGVAVRYLPPPAGSIAPDQPIVPALCVFPRYVAGAATVLRRLSPADALGRLLDEAIAIPKDMEVGEVATLVELAERMSCWEMTSSDLDDAARQVMAMASRLATDAAKQG